MRKLTLHEKISIKGHLSGRCLPRPRLEMAEAVFLWNWCFRRPISRWCAPRTHFHKGGANVC